MPPTFWIDFPSITVIGLGTLADRPTNPESRHHAYWSWDTKQLWFADNYLQWVTFASEVSGFFDHAMVNNSGEAVTNNGGAPLWQRSF